MSNPFDPERLRLPDELIQERLISDAPKLKRRRKQFTILPMTWYEHMKGADGQTYRVAWYLLHLHWKNNGDPFKVGNGMLKIDGVPPTTKLRALRDLERRGLIIIEWRPCKSPVVKLCKIAAP
jgi:hypothetical protein